MLGHSRSKSGSTEYRQSAVQWVLINVTLFSFAAKGVYSWSKADHRSSLLFTVHYVFLLPRGGATCLERTVRKCDKWLFSVWSSGPRTGAMRPKLLWAVFILTNADELLQVHHNHVHPNCAPGVRLHLQECEWILSECEDSAVVEERFYQVNWVNLLFHQSAYKKKAFHLYARMMYET